jgi:hypothetical protein
LWCVKCHGSFGELPTRDPLAYGRGLQIVETDSIILFLLLLWFLHGNQTLRERVFIDVVLIVELWLRVTTLTFSRKEATMVQLKVILIHLHEIRVGFQIMMQGVVQNN